MHITLQDQETNHKVVLCIDRETKQCNVLECCCAAHLVPIVAVAKSLGASVIRMQTDIASVPKGWEVDASSVVAVRRL